MAAFTFPSLNPKDPKERQAGQARTVLGAAGGRNPRLLDPNLWGSGAGTE